MRFSSCAPLLFISFAVFGWPAETRQSLSTTRVRFERLAQVTTHFATGDIINNRWSEAGRWPVDLFEQQQHVLEELGAASLDRAALQTLVRDPDPRIRTLALGALFVREDPRDLPLIAGLAADGAATFPLLDRSLNSMGGRLPLSAFESPQTVGDVARAMIGFYLNAADLWASSTVLGKASALPSSVFDAYWTERSSRAWCASWFLVKMRRATRRTSPLQPQYEGDVRRVLSEIDALPPVERAWTLLDIRADQGQIAPLVPDAALVTALQAVGPAALMTFLRRESATDDPDVRAGAAHPGSMAGFILDHAPKLLRASDADAVVAAAEAYRSIDNNTRFVAAAYRLRALENVERAANGLKAELRNIPLSRTLGARDQAVLAFTLWQLRGAVEREFLADWFYTAQPAGTLMHDVAGFLRDVQKEARPDTPRLLSAIVRHPRFDEADWFSLAEIFAIVNETLPTPLVDSRRISDYFPGSQRPDQQEELAAWRTVLRRHFSTIQ
jgi:hypothetical protein